MQITLRYGREGLEVPLPDPNVRHVLRFKPLPVIDDPQRATRRALGEPIGCAPLRELARGRTDACIVTADITRPVPNAVLLPVLLAELEAGGLSPDRVTILIGTGAHRPNTPDELREMLGDEVMHSGARVVNHVARDTDAQVYRGETSRGTPVYVDRLYAESDLKIAVSLVEPHLIAGFSGGRKAICPGVCGVATILRFHAPPLVQHDSACAGLIDGNPAHQESLEVATMAGGADLTVNVTLDESRRMTGVFAGELEAAHLAAVARYYTQSKVTIPEPVDIAVTTAAGHPLDLTFYQSVKGMVAPLPILKEGGTIIVAHECAEGLGEADFGRRLLALEDVHAYVPRSSDLSFFCLNQWHSQYSKVLRRGAEVLSFSGCIPREQLGECFVTPIDSVEDGVERALRRHGPDATIAVVPEGPYVLACLKGDRIDRQEFGEPK